MTAAFSAFLIVAGLAAVTVENMGKPAGMLILGGIVILAVAAIKRSK